MFSMQLLFRCVSVTCAVVFIITGCGGEDCVHVSDCTVTSCSSGGSLMCTHEGKCTCAVICKDGTNYTHRCGSNPTIPDSAECQLWYEYESDHPCECPDGHLHCIDQLCHCGYPPN